MPGRAQGGENGGVPATPGPTPIPARHNARWAVTEQVGDVLRTRWAAELQAVGVHGSLAHGDDADGGGVDIVAVTRWPRAGPRPGARRIDGVIVDLSVISAEEYLRHARTLTTSWPLMADQYITTRAVHDPDEWFPKLRDVHIAHLAHTEGHVFASLAREAWCRAQSAQAHARRLAEWYETESAMIMLSEARLAVALVHGLLTRTYYRNRADAVRRAGVASAHIYELGERLTVHAQELARRGRPIDGDLDDLLGR
jgi:hypothetical protein